MKISYRTKLLASHAAVALVVSGITLLIVDRVVTSRMEEQVDRRLEAHARAIPSWFERSNHPNRLAGRLADVIGARVTFLDAGGVALGDSQAGDPGQRSLPPEVRRAQQGRTGRATRYSRVKGQEVRYSAVPGPESTVIRLGLPIGEITEATAQIRRMISAGAAVSFVLAMLLAIVVARALTRRLRYTTAMAERLGRGDWEIVAPSDPDDEVGVLSRTLAAAAAQLKSSDAQRRRLLSDIAHEIRTPVTSIQGYAETLTRGDADEETRREFLQTIHRNALRIGQLVEDLLELEDLESTAADLEIAPVRVADVVGSAVSTLRPQAEQSSAAIDVDIDAETAALGDPDAIERIILNLLQNSLSYGGERVAVVVSAEDRDETVAITVRDDGPGIDPEHAQRIFERFYRGETGRSRDRGGSGLGLAIARQLAQAMKGSLYLEKSTEGGFAITLELRRP